MRSLRRFVAAARLWLWFRTLTFVMRRNRRCGWYRCGNRNETTYQVGPLEIRVVVRDTREKDGHSREELYQMLQTIRAEELRMGWKVPEPGSQIQNRPGETSTTTLFAIGKSEDDVVAALARGDDMHVDEVLDEVVRLHDPNGAEHIYELTVTAKRRLFGVGGN